MSKRFPIPDFDRDQFKNMSWTSPALIGMEEQARLINACAQGDAGVAGAYPVSVPPAFADSLGLSGDHLHALMCLLPQGRIHLVGRSWAWPIQRAVVLDSLIPSSAKTLADWTTPRPMNTRLGPQEGIEVDSPVHFVIFAHRIGQGWVGNRTLHQLTTDAHGGSLELMSACSEDVNDFHACNLTFQWAN